MAKIINTIVANVNVMEVPAAHSSHTPGILLGWLMKQNKYIPTNMIMVIMVKIFTIFLELHIRSPPHSEPTNLQSW